MNLFRIGRKVAVTAKTKKQRGMPLSFTVKAALLILMPISLCGCTSGSFDLFDSTAKVDRSISTSSVPKRSQEAVSDQATVLNAVTSTDVEKLAGAPLPWANTSTGSAGVVSEIHETADAGTRCRRFVTTRHAYDGIAQFNGQACLDGTGQWSMMDFQQRTN